MKQIEWLDGDKYNLKDSKRFIEFMQMKHPFCEEINNKEYMKGVRNVYTKYHNIDEKLIDISSEDAFVKSFEALGMVRIIK